jgi:hypothetical protein
MKETLVQKQVRLVLEEQCRDLGRLLRDASPAGTGFALFLFDLGAKGNLAYVSTADREDMVRCLHEWMERAGGPVDQRLRAAEKKIDAARELVEAIFAAPDREAVLLVPQLLEVLGASRRGAPG